MNNKQRPVRLGERLESRDLLSVDLIADFNLNKLSSNPSALVQLGEDYLFAASSHRENYGLWRFDPNTNVSTALLEDIEIHTFARQQPFWVVENQVFLLVRVRGDDGDRLELWASDGTTAGTRRLLTDTHIKPLLANDEAFVFNTREAIWRSDGTHDGTFRLIEKRPSAGPFDLNGTIVFEVESEQSRTFELRRSDKTLTGTEVFAKDFRIGRAPHVVADGRLYFALKADDQGTELWVTDGTASGTRIVRRFAPEPDGSGIDELHVAEDGTVYFAAYTSAAGVELWRTRGTAPTTHLVADIAVGLESSRPHGFWSNGPTTFFAAASHSAAVEIWSTDGTSDGTRAVADIAQGTNGSSFHPMGNIGDEVVYHDGDNRMWITDGTRERTSSLGQLSSPAFRPFSVADHVVYAARDPSGAGYELGVTDGTLLGTHFQDLNPGFSSSSPSKFQEIDDKLYFIADSGEGNERFVYDLSTEGAQQLESLNSTTVGSTPLPLGRLPNGTAVIVADNGRGLGSELWAADPDGEVRLLQNFGPGESSAAIRSDAVLLGQDLYLVADGELWATDGTTTGTRRATELRIPNEGSSVPGDHERLAVVGDSLFFIADRDGEKWLAMTDGTTAGTQLVKHLGAIEYFEMEEFRGELVFLSSDPTRGSELWITNGRPAGTRLVKDILEGPEDSLIRSLTVVQDRLYFRAFNSLPYAVFGLWTSDGTELGTSLLVDQPTGELYAGSRWLYFRSDDSVHGVELWRSDGTAVGTFMVYDINPSGNSNPDVRHLFEVDGTTYFTASDGFSEQPEYWKTGGSPLDTQKVSPLVPELHERLILRPWDGKILMQNGNRFYETDGTLEGTRELLHPQYTLSNESSSYVDTLHGSVFAGLPTLELGTEPFLITPLEQSNPRVIDFVYNESTHPRSIVESVSITFNADVSSSLEPDDLLITSPTSGGRPVQASTASLAWNDKTNTATWDLTSLELGYGVYNFEIGRRAVYDRQNNRLDGNGDGINGDSYRTRVVTALPGDVDLDGRVDFRDLLILSDEFADTNKGWEDGDLNDDGIVSLADFLILSAHFGTSISL